MAAVDGCRSCVGWSAVACGILGQERDSLNLLLLSDNVDVLDIRTGIEAGYLILGHFHIVYIGR